MANHKNERAELKAQVHELNLRIRDLEDRNRDLVMRHVSEANETAKLKEQLDEGVKGLLSDLQEAMTEIYCKSICMEYGEDVFDEETGELLGKRMTFRALRKNDYKVNMSEELFDPEDEKYISTITVGVTFPERKGEDNDSGRENS